MFIISVLDIEPESEEDEDAIIERRRQLRRAIEQKYQDSASATPQAQTLSPSPPSEIAVESSEKSIEEELGEEEERLEQRSGEGDEEAEPGEREELSKEDPAQLKEEELELKQEKSKFSALRASLRSDKTDMFSSEHFEEMQLVSPGKQHD